MPITTRLRRPLALVTACSLAGTGAATLALAGPAAAATPTVSVVGGTLTWGIKDSFRGYVLGPAGGTITVAGGATLSPASVPTFPVAGGRFDGDALAAHFKGSIRFTGHMGALDLTLSDLKVGLAAGEPGVLTADVTNKAMSGAVTTVDDLPLVELASGAALVKAGIASTLTAAGAPVFGAYPAGTAMDPVDIDLDGGQAASSIDVALTGPAAFGRKRTAHVSVTAQGLPVSGAVRLWIGKKQIGAGTLVGGTASIALPTGLAAGERTLRATYGATSEATASSVTDPIVITKARTVTRVGYRQSTGPVPALTYVVSVGIPGATGVQANGFAHLRLNKATVAQVKIVKGRGQITLARPAAGTNAVTAVFTATRDLLASKSPAVVLKVR